MKTAKSLLQFLIQGRLVIAALDTTRQRPQRSRLAAYLASTLRQPMPVLWDKLTHPLVWPIDLGPPERLVAQSAARYNQPQEVEYASRLVQRGLNEIELALVGGPMASRGRVLDVGCGAGREAIAFTKLSYKVVGIDIAEQMIDAAQRNARQVGCQISFMTLPAHRVTPKLGLFDYILATNGLYSLIPTRALRLKTLQGFRSVLKPTGKVFLGAVAPTVYRPGPRAEFVDCLRHVRRLFRLSGGTAEPGDRLEWNASPISDPRFPVFVHVFLRPQEVEEEVRQAGFDGRFIHPETWQLWLPGPREGFP